MNFPDKALTIVDSQPPSADGGPPNPIALAIGAWVHNKFQRSKSERTKATYERTIKAFRAHLQAQGLDLDSPRQAIRDPLQVWAAQSAGKSGATFNQRLAIVSSFYAFVRKQDRLHRWEEEIIHTENGQTLKHRRKVLVENPAELIERAKVIPYANASALQPTEAVAVLAAIDTSTPLGQRDYALLAVAFTTGRRLAELAGLEWQDVKFRRGQEEVVTLDWRRAKGGKHLEDRLEPPVAAALLRYLRAVYGPSLRGIAPSAPVWVAFDFARELTGGKKREPRKPSAALSPRAIEYLCVRHLGLGKAHVTRYTFALGMKKAGASRDDIKERMAHESGDTTDKYLPQLERAENPFSAKVAALFGLH